MRLIILLLALSSIAFASIDKAPESFSSGNSKFVFADFSEAFYEINFDITNKQSSVVSTINFSITEAGKPIFDLIPSSVTIEIDGQNIEALSIKDPDGVTNYRALNAVLAPGQYQMTMRHQFSENTTYKASSVMSGFWISDLEDRKYLEQYIPTNLEYDQFKMTFVIKLIGSSSEHTIYTNGELTQYENNQFSIEFPEYFTSSSLYFHITEKGRFSEKRFFYKSRSGAQIPVTAYSKWAWNISGIESKVNTILNELEDKFGYWGHPSLTIYIAGMGGMEHSGATITSKSALGHELTHSYFARGVMPVDGNSGWLDEAIASWRDGGYKSVTSPNFSSTKMSAHSQYTRITDRKAYTEGANFMAYLNSELRSLGGLRVFLETIYSQYNHSNISTDLFKLELELFSSKDFSSQFNQYIYGRNSRKSLGNRFVHDNPYHPVLSAKELKELL